MGTFLKKVQSLQEYYEKVKQDENSGYLFSPVEEVQLPNVCYIANVNEVRYNNNDRLVVDVFYAVQGWDSYEGPENPVTEKELNILGDIYSSDDDEISVDYSQTVLIKNYIDKIEYAVQNGSTGEYTEDFYNATVSVPNPGEGNEAFVRIRFYIKIPVVSSQLLGLSDAELCRLEVSSGCMAVDSYIFGTSANAKYIAQYVFHDVVPAEDRTYDALYVAQNIHIYVPEVAEEEWKGNDFYAAQAELIDGYEVGAYPETTQDIYGFNGLRFELMEEE